MHSKNIYNFKMEFRETWLNFKIVLKYSLSIYLRQAAMMCIYQFMFRIMFCHVECETTFPELKRRSATGIRSHFRLSANEMCSRLVKMGLHSKGRWEEGEDCVGHRVLYMKGSGINGFWYPKFSWQISEPSL